MHSLKDLEIRHEKQNPISFLAYEIINYIRRIVIASIYLKNTRFMER